MFFSAFSFIFFHAFSFLFPVRILNVFVTFDSLYANDVCRSSWQWTRAGSIFSDKFFYEVSHRLFCFEAKLLLAAVNLTTCYTTDQQGLKKNRKLVLLQQPSHKPRENQIAGVGHTSDASEVAR